MRRCRRPGGAVAEYEKALALPYTRPDLPDRDEQARHQQRLVMTSAARQIGPGADSQAGLILAQGHSEGQVHLAEGPVEPLQASQHVELEPLAAGLASDGNEGLSARIPF